MPTMDNFTLCPALMLQSYVTTITLVCEVDTNLSPISDGRVRECLITILRKLGLDIGPYALVNLPVFSQSALPK